MDSTTKEEVNAKENKREGKKKEQIRQQDRIERPKQTNRNKSKQIETKTDRAQSDHRHMANLSRTQATAALYHFPRSEQPPVWASILISDFLRSLFSLDHTHTTLQPYV